MHIAKICRGALVAMAIIVPSAASAQRPENSGPQANPAADPLCSEAFRNDAALHDLCFVDAQSGWAVGDRGTIWATTDGGEHWQLQDSGVACPLYSVTFVDPQTGWAAGGAADPFVHTGSGLLLLTHDGGKTWVHDPRLQLPVLRKIHFFDPRHGWAVGFRSAMYPSGAFATDSGGRNWQPYPAGNSPGWLAAAFFDGRDGMLAGRDSRPGRRPARRPRSPAGRGTVPIFVAGHRRSVGRPQKWDCPLLPSNCAASTPWRRCRRSSAGWLATAAWSP